MTRAFFSDLMRDGCDLRFDTLRIGGDIFTVYIDGEPAICLDWGGEAPHEPDLAELLARRRPPLPGEACSDA